MCMIEVSGDISVSGCQKKLYSPVVLNGALAGNNSMEPTVFINRTMKEQGMYMY